MSKNSCFFTLNFSMQVLWTQINNCWEENFKKNLWNFLKPKYKNLAPITKYIPSCYCGLLLNKAITISHLVRIACLIRLYIDPLHGSNLKDWVCYFLLYCHIWWYIITFGSEQINMCSKLQMHCLVSDLKRF